MPGIFITYRRHDSSGHAGRLFDRLKKRYGSAKVFMDVAGIGAGADFIDAIERGVAGCDALVAVIGREWLTCTNERGLRRIDDLHDFVRLEIATALQRSIPIIAALVDDAAMPRAEALPDALKGLNSAPAVRLELARWDSDAEALIAALDTTLGLGRNVGRQPRWRLSRLLGAAGLFGLVLVALIVALTRSDNRLTETRPDKGAVRVTPEETFESGAAGVKALAALRGGELVSAGGDGVRLWSLATGKVERVLGNEMGDVLALAPLAGGRLAAGMRNGTIALWNLERGEAEAILSGHAEAVMALTPFWDNRLASGSSDRTVRLWNLQTRKLDATLEGHTNQVRTLVELPKQRVASGSLDGTIRVWNLSVAPLRVKTLTGRGLAINALAPLIADQIASGTEDGTIELWDVASGAVASLLKARDTWVTTLVALPDGRLVVGQQDGSVTLWNLASGKLEAILEGHTKGINALVLLSDGRLASGSDDHTIRLWKVPPP